MKGVAEKVNSLKLGSRNIAMNKQKLERTEGGILASPGRPDGNKRHFGKVAGVQPELIFDECGNDGACLTQVAHAQLIKCGRRTEMTEMGVQVPVEGEGDLFDVC